MRAGTQAGCPERMGLKVLSYNWPAKIKIHNKSMLKYMTALNVYWVRKRRDKSFMQDPFDKPIFYSVAQFSARTSILIL